MVAFDPDVTIAVELGFGSGPYDTAPTWVNVAADVRQLTIRRGRGHDLDRVSASSLTVLLDNTSGNYDTSNTAGTYYGNVEPMTPVRVTATYSAVTYNLFYGMVEAWPMSWPDLDSDATVSLTALDGMKLLNFVNTGTAEVQESSEVRVGNLLDDAGWPATWRNLSVGDFTVQAYTPTCSSILSLIRQVEDTEGGLFFIDGSGTATFQNQSHRSGAVSSQTFGDSGTEIRYTDAELSYDDMQIYNRVEVSRVGGATVAAQDATSIASYGERVLTRFDTLHVSDVEATTAASNLVARYKDPHLLVDSLQLSPQRDKMWAEVLGLEISDLVTLNRRPAAAGNTITFDMYVESISTTVNPAARTWVTVLSGTQYV